MTTMHIQLVATCIIIVFILFRYTHGNSGSSIFHTTPFFPWNYLLMKKSKAWYMLKDDRVIFFILRNDSHNRHYHFIENVFESYLL